MLIAKEYQPYEAVYRSREAVMAVFPISIAATLVAIIILATIYAKGYEGGSDALEGPRCGALIGIFHRLRRCCQRMRHAKYRRPPGAVHSHREVRRLAHRGCCHRPRL